MVRNILGSLALDNTEMPVLTIEMPLLTISWYSLASESARTTFLAVERTDEIPTVLADSVKQSLA